MKSVLAGYRRNPFSPRKRVSAAAIFGGNCWLSDSLLVLEIMAMDEN
jgi:hypothetical protein